MSAAQTGARLRLNCQSPNKPDRGIGLPASAARNDPTQPRTSSRYGLRLRALSWGYWPEKRLIPDDMKPELSRYTSFLRVVSSTLRLVRIMNNTIFPYYKHVLFCSSSVSVVIKLVSSYCSPKLCMPESLEGDVPIEFSPAHRS